MKTKLKIKSLCKNDYEYVNNPTENINIYDKIVLYNDGLKWKIVQLDICLMYSIIYDTYQNGETKYDTTLIVCPVSLRAVSLKGKFLFKTYDGTKMILEEDNDNNTIIPIDMNHKIDDKYMIYSNRRSEVKIMIIRDALMIAPDVFYLQLKQKKIKSILPDKYYENFIDVDNNQLESVIHPKTLVYLIQHKQKNKISILLGKNSTKNTVTGYNLKKSGITSYLMKHHDAIVEKEGYIMPILWYVAKQAYPNAKVISVF